MSILGRLISRLLSLHPIWEGQGVSAKRERRKKRIQMKPIKGIGDLVVLIRGGGEVASGVAHRLHQAHFKICMTEISHPLAVRREVAFSEAIYEGEKEVEGIRAKLITKPEQIESLWKK